MAMTSEELRATIEAILFVAGEPVSLENLAEAFPGEGSDAITRELEEIRRKLDEDQGSGFILETTAGGYRFATRPAFDSVLRKFYSKQGEHRLSIAALETLAIVAYRQPITAPEVSDIRGVNSSGVLRTLLERRMIRIAGRKTVVGSPFLYRTTREFLVHFGLNDIRDLPKLEEFGDMLGEGIVEELLLPQEESEPSDDDSSEAASLEEGDGFGTETAEEVTPEPSVEEQSGGEGPELYAGEDRSGVVERPLDAGSESEEAGAYFEPDMAGDRVDRGDEERVPEQGVTTARPEEQAEDRRYGDGEKTVEFPPNDSD